MVASILRDTGDDANREDVVQIGLFIEIAEDEETSMTPSYQRIRDTALQAEERGLDSIWVMDHLLFRHQDQPSRGVWEGWTILTALAEATKRVTLGTLVLCTGYRNPAMLAKMAATLDEISAGRLILGIGAGWHEPEYEAFGLPHDHRVGRFEEAIQIISPLLREGRVDFHGKYYDAPNCEILPRGPSARGPKILIGTKGPRMMRLLARHADMWNTCWLGQPPGPLLERRAQLEAACADEGRDPKTVEVTVGVALDYQEPTKSAEPQEHPERMLRGAPEDLATAFREYEKLGVAHLICAINIRSTAAIDWLADGVQLWRDTVTVH